MTAVDLYETATRVAFLDDGEGPLHINHPLASCHIFGKSPHLHRLPVCIAAPLRRMQQRVCRSLYTLVSLLSLSHHVSAFAPRHAAPTPRQQQQQNAFIRQTRQTRPLQTELGMVAGSGLESVVAGAIAGAIGIGVAFPFDAIRTQVQVLRTQAVPAVVDESGGAVAASSKSPSMLDTVQYIWQREGVKGFFSGVQSMMIGQAVVKSMAFSTNSFAISFLAANQFSHDLPHSLQLFMAACFAGFVASFVVAPVERVSVIMQAQTKYASEWDCLMAVLQKEGPVGICTRGLGATFAREVPSDGIYFWLYGILSHSPYAPLLGGFGPLVFGAFAGMCSWVPIYPVDVVKTAIQNDDEGSSKASFMDVAMDLYDKGGVGVFFDGFDAKLIRAAVHHAMTFAVYEAVLGYLHHG
jgi:Mitochondrial carrier protein